MEISLGAIFDKIPCTIVQGLWPIPKGSPAYVWRRDITYSSDVSNEIIVINWFMR